MYEDDFLLDERDPDFQEDEEFYGDYGDFEDDDDRFADFLDTPGTTMGKAEITAFERVGPSMIDPWILKMTIYLNILKNLFLDLPHWTFEKK